VHLSAKVRADAGATHHGVQITFLKAFHTSHSRYCILSTTTTHKNFQHPRISFFFYHEIARDIGDICGWLQVISERDLWGILGGVSEV
jgi:hypothetical protein